MPTATLATWNVNSIRARLDHVLGWLQDKRPAVLALQETKVVDPDFPVEPFANLGYAVQYAGQKTYNGVATAALTEGADVLTELPGVDAAEKRFLAATFGDWRIINVYVPNGTAVGHARYDSKLTWLAALRDQLQVELQRHQKLVVMGDFNVAPAAADVHDPAAWEGQILCSDGERQALRRVLDTGLTDVFRTFPQEPDVFSWWDYRAAAFRRNHGLRIDLLLTSPVATAAARSCWVDRAMRAVEKPSDHAPVALEVEW